MITTLNFERAELRNFTADVQAETARSLELLRAIEGTLAWLERLTCHLRADANFAVKANAGLDQVVGVIDPDNSLHDALETAQQTVEALYDLLIVKRQYGRNDNQLTEDDGIESAYTDAIAQAADLQNAINTLRWNIGEHDIDAVPHVSDPSMVGSTPEEIKAIFDRLLSE